ncbi:hypothetical protein CTA1_1924 [Colletotrichum tanaceti]|uniref:Uncharacterized protein n=1 Tax=Colletotrichum tanaceti TaxID=1306861 RepID=A0A4U6X1N7_9PEZI|nr:hypothetical protein CTA1_1924 [Colletotrichum tanaceti]
MVGRCLDRDHDSLVVLIEAGADVFSRDNEGRSIWETAIENRQQGSYARDAVDSVLVSYGYHAEVSRFAEKSPRHATYTGWYDRYHFNLMWEGNEHLCPYYDDEALGLDMASFRHEKKHYESSDSSCDVEELGEEEYGETGSEENEYPGSEEIEVLESEDSEEPGSPSRQSEPDEANNPLEGSLAGISKETDSEPESATESGSQSSPSRYLHQVLGDSEQRVPLSAAASVASWLSVSTSRSPREAVLENPSPRGHETLGALSYSPNAEHEDEIFHNPWTEGHELPNNMPGIDILTAVIGTALLGTALLGTGVHGLRSGAPPPPWPATLASSTRSPTPTPVCCCPTAAAEDSSRGSGCTFSTPA